MLWYILSFYLFNFLFYSHELISMIHMLCMSQNRFNVPLFCNQTISFWSNLHSIRELRPFRSFLCVCTVYTLYNQLLHWNTFTFLLIDFIKYCRKNKISKYTHRYEPVQFFLFFFKKTSKWSWFDGNTLCERNLILFYCMYFRYSVKIEIFYKALLTIYKMKLRTLLILLCQYSTAISM